MRSDSGAGIATTVLASRAMPATREVKAGSQSVWAACVGTETAVNPRGLLTDLDHFDRY